MPIPIIDVQITLNRIVTGVNTGAYRPHLVISGSGDAEEHYMGVAFVGGVERLDAGQCAEVQLALVYFPNVDYTSLQPGVVFCVREGRRTVGYGTVMSNIALATALAESASANALSKSKPRKNSQERRQRLSGDLSHFVREYARKAQRHTEPNDRRYDRSLEKKVKTMDPFRLSDLLSDEDKQDGRGED